MKTAKKIKPKSDAAIHQGDLTAKPGVVYECAEITGSLDATGADISTEKSPRPEKSQPAPV